MVGATLSSVIEIAPNAGLKLIYFEVTLDGSAKADFSGYSDVKIVQAWDATNPGATAETVTAVTDGGDVTFTNNSNAIVGFAIVQE